MLKLAWAFIPPPVKLGLYGLLALAAIGLVGKIGWMVHRYNSIPQLEAKLDSAIGIANDNADKAAQIGAAKDAQIAAIAEQLKRSLARATVTAKTRTEIQHVQGEDPPAGPRTQLVFDRLRGNQAAPTGGGPASPNPGSHPR